MEPYGRMIFSLGDTTAEEISNIYQLLKYISDNNIHVHGHLTMGYSSSNKYQENVKGFNERVVLVLIRHIEGYLTKIGIDMGIDETTKYSITVNNGQVNLASDNASIHAIQNNGVDTSRLEELISSILDHSSEDMHTEDIELIKDSIEVIRDEVVKNKPKKGIVKTALVGLQAIKGSAEFTAAVIALYQFVSPLIS